MIHIAFVMIGYWKSVIGDIKYQMMISLKRKFYHFLSGDDEVDDDAIGDHAEFALTSHHVADAMIILIIITRSYATLRAAYLDWIVGPGYSLGGYILGCSQRLSSCHWQ